MKSPWLSRLLKPGTDTINGVPVLPWSFETEYPDEAIFYMTEYGYLCVTTRNGFFVMVRREGCVNGISHIGSAEVRELVKVANP